MRDHAAELALAAALLWLVHPLQTESVTYVVHRAEALAGLFFLLTLYCLLRGATGKWPLGWYLLAVLGCALAMKSKEVAVTAPLVALLFDRAFLAVTWGEVLRRRGALHLSLMATWVLLAPALALAFVSTPWAAAAPAFSTPPVPRVVPQDAAPVLSAGFGMRQLRPLEYVGSQPGVILHYLRLAFWPDSLCIDYGWPVARTAAQIVPQTAVVLLLLLACLWAWRRYRAVGFVGLSFFVLLLPTSSIMPINDLAAERRMYLPLACVAILVVVGGYLALEGLVRRQRLALSNARRLEVGVVVLVAILLIDCTDQRNRQYCSELVMWSDVVAKRPYNPRGHLNLAVAMTKHGNMAGAEGCLLTAHQLNPKLPLVNSSLGRIYLAQKRPEEAARCFQRELEVSPGNAAVLDNLGTALQMQGKYDEAVATFELALRIDGSSGPTHAHLGRTLLLQHKPDQALPHLQQAIRRNPYDHETLDQLGQALLDRGRAVEAVDYLQEAVRLKPDSPQYQHHLDQALERADAQEPHRKGP